MILLVDNYDAFTYNLAQYIAEFNELIVARNDTKELKQLAENAEAIVFSPGPGKPREAGQMEEIIHLFYEQKPLLGICLGHQAIAETFGGEIINASRVRHGEFSQVQITETSRLFAKIEKYFTVMRYHSLTVSEKSLPSCLKPICFAKDDRELMAIEHQTLPVYGVQFHPESIGTEFGKQMIKNFVSIATESER